MQSIEWSKYVSWICCMAPAVLTRAETYKFLQEAHTASIVAAIVREMTQLATAQGIVLEDMAFFPIKTLSQRSLADMVTHVRHLGDQFASLAPTQKMSTLQDVERGKRLEVEETLGYAVRQSAALGLPTPTLDVCYNLIAGINHYLQ
jgi:ketopantoate reductase